MRSICCRLQDRGASPQFQGHRRRVVHHAIGDQQASQAPAACVVEIYQRPVRALTRDPSDAEAVSRLLPVCAQALPSTQDPACQGAMRRELRSVHSARGAARARRVSEVALILRHAKGLCGTPCLRCASRTPPLTPVSAAARSFPLLLLVPRRKSAIVLKSGASRPLSHMSSTLLLRLALQAPARGNAVQVPVDVDLE